jgi:L-2-hydroxycarboxylate dehydrogenase (NAD+)
MNLSFAIFATSCLYAINSIQAAPSSLRSELLGLVGKSPSGHLDTKIINEFSTKLKAFAETPGVDSSDIIFAIGSSVFGVDITPPQTQTAGSVEKPVIVDFLYMKQFMKDVFLSYGCTEDQAEVSSDVLIEADKRGIDSHGLGRLKPIYCDRIDKGILWANKPITIIKETETTALVDGNLGLGLYIGPYCMNLAIEKAKKYGVGFVAVQRSTHYGIAGYYSSMAADAGCVGLCGTNARPSIAPTFGVEPMLGKSRFNIKLTNLNNLCSLANQRIYHGLFSNLRVGTNPLCFGIPSDDNFPFVIDCATSVNQRGKIEKYAREGVETPRGAVIDNEGIERTDTEGILRDMVLGKCALTPLGGAGDKMGGYKGYGWATTVELLCTAFQSGPFGDDICGIDRSTGKPKPMPLGHFFLAINIESLCSLDTFKKNTGNLLRALRQSMKSPKGPGRIWTAGELENDARISRTAQGGMKVPKVLQQNMIDLRDKHPDLKEKYHKFPFE